MASSYSTARIRLAGPTLPVRAPASTSLALAVDRLVSSASGRLVSWLGRSGWISAAKLSLDHVVSTTCARAKGPVRLGAAGGPQARAVACYGAERLHYCTVYMGCVRLRACVRACMPSEDHITNCK